jgi:hypothetical protein
MGSWETGAGAALQRCAGPYHEDRGAVVMAQTKGKRTRSDATRDMQWALSARYFWQEDRARKQRAAADNISTAFGLDGCLFSKLAKIALVPAENIERLRKDICFDLSESCALSKLSSAPPIEEPLSMKREIAQLARLARLARDLTAAASSLHQQALRTVLWADLKRCKRANKMWTGHWLEVRWSNFENSISEFADLSLEALSMAREPAPSGSRGRPGGRFAFPLTGSLIEFAFRLLLDIRAAGGRLTLDKNVGKGTLIETLELLRPHLPSGYIPRSLPLSTLARVKALDQKIAAMADPFE